MKRFSAWIGLILAILIVAFVVRQCRNVSADNYQTAPSSRVAHHAGSNRHRHTQSGGERAGGQPGFGEHLENYSRILIHR